MCYILAKQHWFISMWVIKYHRLFSCTVGLTYHKGSLNSIVLVLLRQKTSLGRVEGKQGCKGLGLSCEDQKCSSCAGHTQLACWELGHASQLLLSLVFSFPPTSHENTTWAHETSRSLSSWILNNHCYHFILVTSIADTPTPWTLLQEPNIEIKIATYLIFSLARHDLVLSHGWVCLTWG